ncbi:MAG TPA: MFS transporter [bacterium]|nr:MFS transporter [bacterium]
MFKIFSKNEKSFLLHQVLTSIPFAVVGTFITFYLWDQTKSLQLVANYHFFRGVGILGGAFLSSYFISKFTPNIVRAGGITLYAFVALLIVLLGASTANYTLLIGILVGLSVGIRVVPYRVMFATVNKPESRQNFLNLSGTFGSVFTIFLPLAAAFFVGDKGEYGNLFVFIFITLLVSVIPLLFMKLPKSESKRLKLKEAFVQIIKDSDLKRLLVTRFLDGIKFGVKASLWSIIVLSVVGGLENWGIFNTVFAVLSTIISYTIGKKVKFSNSGFLIIFMSSLLMVAGLIFAANLDLISYILYSFIAGFADTLYSRSYASIRYKVMDRNVDEVDTLDEIDSISEIPVFLGRSIPLLIIMFTAVSFESDLVLRILIIVVSTIPLFVSTIFVGMNIMERSKDPFVAS